MTTEHTANGSRITKAVIPAAGLGTRFLPATKSQPKEMLPVVDKPAIQYVVEEAVGAGLTDILIITGRSKRAIEDHFDRNVELEVHLEATGRTELLGTLRADTESARIHYVRQREPLGLGHAVSLARDHVGDEPFAVLLGDDILGDGPRQLRAMVDTFGRTGASVLALEEVAPEAIGAYGCVDVGDEIVSAAQPTVRVRSIVEKPDPAEAPSNLAVIGRYVLAPVIFEALEDLPPGRGGEIQLTDAIAVLTRTHEVYGELLAGARFDVGTPLGLLRATVELALRREDLGPSVRKWLGELLDADDGR